MAKGRNLQGVPAFTVEQPVDALKVLESRAAELKASSLTVVSESSDVSELKLGLAGTHQKQNAILAVALARSFLQSRSENVGEGSFLPDPFRDGLIGARWPGRCQNVIDPKRSDFTWFLDGAHTVESLACCIQWFVTPGVGIPLAESTCTRTSSSFLIFNCTSGRSGEIFLRQVQETIRAQLLKYKRDIDGDLFDHVIFCANVTYADGHFKGGEERPTSLNHH